MVPSGSFRIGLTDDGVYDKIMHTASAREALEGTPGVEIAHFPASKDPVPPDLLNSFDAVLAGGSLFTLASTAGVERCSLIARFGAGYDRVNLDACTGAGIIVATTPGGVRRSMATSALTHILVLTTRFIHKSRLTYTGRWGEAQNAEHLGMGLGGKTIGYIGFGSIGRDLYTLISPFEMRHIVFDPYLDEKTATGYPIERVSLDALLSQSDIVVIACTLTDETRHLINKDTLSRMKRSAYLVNVARGAIVDQKALACALAEGQIRGAGLDALDPEPIEPDDPLLSLDNAILTPHAIGVTDEMVRLCSEMCVKAALDVMQAVTPASVINRAVLDSPKLKAKLAAYRQRFGG